jgi:hypothetical protein
LSSQRRNAASFAILAVLLINGNAAAQQPAPQINPADLGLMVPESGLIRPGEGRRVLVNDDGKEAVAKILVDVADYRVVEMPDGRLKSVPADEAKATDQPFVPMTKSEVATNLTFDRFKGFRTRSTRRFVYIYNTSEGFYTATSRILESMYPAVLAYFERQKELSVHEAEVPLVIIMFRTEKEFQNYMRMPEGVVAYYNAVSNHVVMYEQSALVEIAPELAVKQSIATIAHEGVHQILHNIGVQGRLAAWPMWISEGLAEYFAPTSVDRRSRWKGVGTPNDVRMYELVQYVKKRPPGTETGSLVRRVVESAEFNSLEYAASWALTHLLATRNKEKFLGYIAEISKTQPLADRDTGESKKTSADLVEVFTKHFGSDYEKLEKDLFSHLRKLPYTDPIENQTHYVAMFVLDRGATIQRKAGVTTSPAAVRKWQNEALSELPAAQRNRVSFRYQVFPSKSAASRYADQWLNSRAD